MLQPIIVASPSSGGTSNAESMRPMGFQYWLDHLLQNMHYPLQVLLYILAACWLYQGIENLNARYASSIGKPARAAIWCLIPAVNLISSIFFLDRLWRASIDIHDWKQRSTPLLLPIWWMVWLASVLSIKLSIFLGNSIEYHIRFEKRLIEHDLISLLALVLSVIVVLRVTQAQRRQFGA
ncbi:hypothetical protein DYGSA30_18070 [Dyella sp. GSA-30]|nr:hypothetical protein DYGSA30_18070 [Dyella sp. GSA-30]